LLEGFAWWGIDAADAGGNISNDVLWRLAPASVEQLAGCLEAALGHAEIENESFHGFPRVGSGDGDEPAEFAPGT
jgi:hypothetical protein